MAISTFYQAKIALFSHTENHFLDPCLHNGADDNNVNDNLTDDNVTVCTDDNVTGDDDSDDDSTRLWAKKRMISRPDTVPSQ